MKKRQTAAEKTKLIFQFIDRETADSGTRSRALNNEEERLLRSMAEGGLSEADLARCQKLLLGNRLALEFVASQLRGESAPSRKVSRDVLA